MKRREPSSTSARDGTSGEMDPVAIWWPYPQGIPTGSKGPRPHPETLRLPLVHLPGCGPKPRMPRLNTQFSGPIGFNQVEPETTDGRTKVGRGS